MSATAATDLLTPDLVARLLILAYAPGVHAVSVVGSAARGDATEWSDIDLHACVRLSEQKFATRVRYLEDGRLVMVASDTLAEMREELAEPARAVWAVPALRDMRILLDQERSLGALQDEARAFEWSRLEARAKESERQRLVASIEYVHKIRAAVERADESAALHAERALVERCTRAVVTATGTFIRTENEYFARAREVAGPQWTELHRLAFGLEGGDAFTRARIACLLFAETARVLDDILDGSSRELIRRGLAVAP
ncbi:MAG TPA: nucleotidyltransferase domain-containing protein [Candidatus Limnocylindria bacterium]|nr:nucleotidyltransferase domain-containing protein [Candidatus Limnocylindria bacterium]